MSDSYIYHTLTFDARVLVNDPLLITIQHRTSGLLPEVTSCNSFRHCAEAETVKRTCILKHYLQSCYIAIHELFEEDNIDRLHDAIVILEQLGTKYRFFVVFCRIISIQFTKP